MTPYPHSFSPSGEQCRESCIGTALLRQASLASFRVDAAHNILGWNDSAEGLLGVPAIEAIGQCLARLVNEAVVQVRKFSRGLHPVEWDATGLMTALQQLAERSGQIAGCVFRCDHHLVVNSTRNALLAYRIAQAAETAALQETQATRIEITLCRAGGSFLLQVTDDGKTEEELTAEPNGVAAQTLHYRTQAMRGSLAIKFESTLGTRITCLFPA